MDFTFNEEQEAMRDLAAQILTEKLPPERIRAIEDDADGRWFADDVWRELAKADLLGIGLPEDEGGGGYSLMEVCLLLEQQGRTVAPLPLLPALVLGALPLARFGTADQRAALLPGVVGGELILTAALAEDSFGAVPAKPATTATKAAAGWRLDGEKALVPAADLAARILVPAKTSEQASGIFLVDPASSGVELERNVLVNGEPRFTVRLNGVAVRHDDIVGPPDAGDTIMEWIVPRATAALCAMQTGVCDAALKITAGYVSEREQFGAKIGTFQAVAQRLADAYIDTEGVRLTALQAVWRLAEELPADDEVHIAKFWASDAGHRVVHACQHVHGGIGVDIDYPIHRYFRWAKAIEFTLGSATEHLRGLGSSLAELH